MYSGFVDEERDWLELWYLISLLCGSAAMLLGMYPVLRGSILAMAHCGHALSVFIASVGIYSLHPGASWSYIIHALCQN